MNLPAWLPADEWAGFVTMRKAMRNVPFTERAMVLTINRLAQLKQEGYDPAAVLDQSTQRGWRGVFPVQGQESKPQVTMRAIYSASDRAYYEKFYKEHPELKPQVDLDSIH